MIYWKIIEQHERGDETVFKCYRYRDGKHEYVTVRVLTVWWVTKGSVADILAKAERDFREEQKP